MQITGKVCVVTGGAQGIGAAMARRFAQDGAAGVIVADIDGTGAVTVAESIEASKTPSLGLGVDVAAEAEVQALVSAVMARFGRIDIFCSNAGVFAIGGEELSDEVWRHSWEVNVMAHVYASRAVLPIMLAQGGGYLVHTCSSAGVLMGTPAAPYTATKHAAVGFAEWLSVRYGARGIKVSALCPAGVRTDMMAQAARAMGNKRITASGDVLEPEAVAEAVVRGIEAERFLILPHPLVADEMRFKAADHEAWLASLRAAATTSLAAANT